jgi:pimeloyl-ACP methyl ester carboxylesterase
MTENQSAGHTSSGFSYVSLKDGRKLCFTEYGSPDGRPIFYFHGHPGSRLDPGIFPEEAIYHHGIRLIAPDRPGIGRSDFKPGRRIVDWAEDVRELADKLGIERFAVMAASGGGPFAAATAHALPERVVKLGLVSSVGRFDIPGATRGMGPGLMYFRLGCYLPGLSKMMLRMMDKGLKGDQEKMAAQVKRGLPPADLEAMKDKRAFSAFLDTMGEFLYQGPVGPSWEAGLYMLPWGFHLEEIATPAFLWHGEEDRNAPVVMGRDLARRIPGCQAKFIPGEGHFSLLLKYGSEIFETMGY